MTTIDLEALSLLQEIEARYQYRSDPAHLDDRDFLTLVTRGPSLIPTLIYAISAPGMFAPWECVSALWLITNEQPFPDDDLGDLDRIIGAWKVWAAEKGITPEAG